MDIVRIGAGNKARVDDSVAVEVKVAGEVAPVNWLFSLIAITLGTAATYIAAT